MDNRKDHITMDRLRSYSGVFSRNVFTDIIKFNDFSHINWLLTLEENIAQFTTYQDYFKYAYSLLKKYYRCEYFFKNEIISQYIIKKLGTKDSVVFNEFRVGTSIVDLAMFNGESKAFEIKTNFDSPKRLLKQLDDYCKIFNKVYLIVSSDKISFYRNIIPDNIGLLSLIVNRGRVKIDTVREANRNINIDCQSLIKCLRSNEYKNIVYQFYNEFLIEDEDYFSGCIKALEEIPQIVLNSLYLAEIKKRKSVTSILQDIPLEFRQMCLSLNLSIKSAEILINYLSKPININPVCISRI